MRILVTPEEYEAFRDKDNPENDDAKETYINGVKCIWMTVKDEEDGR